MKPPPFAESYEALCADLARTLSPSPRPQPGEPEHADLVADITSALHLPAGLDGIVGPEHEYEGLIADLTASIDPRRGLPAVVGDAGEGGDPPFQSVAEDLVVIYGVAGEDRLLPRLGGWHRALRVARTWLEDLRTGLERMPEHAEGAHSTIPARLAFLDLTVTTVISLLADGLPRRHRTAGDAQRRIATVLFVDLVGFAAMAERLDAADVRDLQRAYFSLVRDVVLRHGGVVEKFIGDAVMAVFGVRSGGDDGAVDAVRAALELTRTLEEGPLAGRWRVRARSGVATGEVVVDLSEGGPGYSGRVVVTAARMQAYAPQGGVAVSAGTRRSTEGSVRYAAEPVLVPGKDDRTMEAWPAVGIVEGARSGGHAPVAPGGPPSGPDREFLAQLGLMLSDVGADLESMAAELPATARLAPGARMRGLRAVAMLAQRVDQLWHALSDFRGADLLPARLEPGDLEDLDGVRWTDDTAPGGPTRWPQPVRRRIVELSTPAPGAGTFVIRSGSARAGAAKVSPLRR